MELINCQNYTTQTLGGAWKVAYADFVTAMMAFFLLMWLLNATTEEQKRGISQYFTPYGQTAGAGGSGGVLGGTSVQSEGVLSDDQTMPVINSQTVSVQLQKDGESSEDGVNKEVSGDLDEVESKEEGLSSSGEDNDLEDEFEQQQLQNITKDIKDIIAKASELKALEKNINVSKTDKGVRIQIFDQGNFSMFPLGSSKMYIRSTKFFTRLAPILAKQPNKVSIIGHTDANPYMVGDKNMNWDLSANRANAARYILIKNGLLERKIESVVGKASNEPFNKSNPKAETNRRIDILVVKSSLKLEKVKS